jgi:hypothetical protein
MSMRSICKHTEQMSFWIGMTFAMKFSYRLYPVKYWAHLEHNMHAQYKIIPYNKHRYYRNLHNT